jgi:poly(hydroxyalkanoate) granule-associated protein
LIGSAGAEKIRQEISMVKKLKDLIKDEDKQLADAVRASAHQIWQAGLGAFAKAQEEGGKVFNKLVQEGTALQRRTRAMSEDRVSDMTDTVTKVADGVSKQASGSWDKLEQVFEDRVMRALGAIGVPTRKDIDALARQVEQLASQVAELSGQKAPAKARIKTAARKPALKAAAKRPATTAVKGSVKKAAPRKPAARKTSPTPSSGA